MKTGSFFSHPYNALILKAAGLILILGTLLDYMMLAIPPNFLNSEWLANLISQWVGRGAVPILGLALLFLGVWFERDSSESRGFKGLPAVALFLSALLGILFLILAPLYFNSSRLASAAQTRQINQQAAQAEQQLNNLLKQQRERVSAIVSNQSQLTQLEQQLNSMDVPEDQRSQLEQIKATLEKVKSDPKALDQEVTKARTQGINQIQARQKAALAKLQSGLRRDRIHNTLESVIFAIGYLVIAWTGLGSGRAKSPKVRYQKQK